MPKNLREMESFSNVAPGAIATANLPVTKAYYGIMLKIQHGASPALMTKAQMKTLLKDIRLQIAGPNIPTDRVWELSAQNLIVRNDFYRIPSADGVLPLIFAEPYWDNPVNEARFKLGTQDLTSVQIQVEFDSTVVNPIIEGFMYEYDGPNEAFGRFIRLAEYQQSNAATGKIEITDIPVQGNGLGLKALHFSTNAIGEIELRAGSKVIYEDRTELRNVLHNLIANRTEGRTPDAAYTHLDLTGNAIANVFNTTGWRDFRVKMDRTASGAFTVLVETVIGQDVPITQ